MRIIAGIYKNRILAAPKNSETRPTAERLREALFNICQTYIEDALFLDLFAGSGAMGLEALSRGTKEATLIDSSKDAVKCIQKNIANLDLGKQAHVYCGDVFLWIKKLEKLGKQFDIIYADPPYGESTFPLQVIEYVGQGSILTSGGTLFIETASGEYLNELHGLKLVSTRKMGKSALHQFTS